MPSFPVEDLGAGPYVHEEPSKRFTVYTRGNAGEVWPEVAYPLSLSLTRTVPDMVMDALIDTGMVTRDEVAEGTTCGGGCFGGYMYINLSLNRLMAYRSPGVSVEDNDAIYLGTEGIGPPFVAQKGDRSLRASLNAVRYVLRLLGTTELPELADDVAFVEAERAKVPEQLQLDDAALVAVIRARVFDTMRLFARHIDVTARAGAAVSFFSTICEKQLGDRSLALSLISGLGDVSSAAPSWGLWDLGRTVAASDELTAAFDDGVEGLAGRLAAMPAASAFNEQFDAFIERFGSRGPNEWESACDTWETRPELALALVDRMRGADERQAPQARNESLAADRQAAIEQVRGRLKFGQKRSFERGLRAASLFSVSRERSKTTVVDLIHQSRLLMRELASRTATRTPDGQWEDLWLCYEDELEAYVADPAAFADTIAKRRATRTELARRVPPFVFEGEMPPVDSWERRDQQTEVEPLTSGQSIEGLPAVTGVAEGRACVVTDPFEPGDLGPGDVLIAPITDPAWTPLFIASEAVVVDVGGQMSHAVIVAREFGMPCVVAATDATRRIPHGARVRVDGSTGTVTVIG